MRESMFNFLESAEKLHRYLVENHWRDGALVGADPGIRWNARIGRFVKSYLPFINWSDYYIYMQAQAYWILTNWQLYDLTGRLRYEQIAIDCTRRLRQLQQADGHWIFPNPEWRDKIQTVEGCFGAIGLTESYRRTGECDFLDGAQQWTQFMIERTGFQQFGNGQMAVNYFVGDPSRRIPNNATLAVQQLARLREVTNDAEHDHLIDGMLAYLKAVQLPSGELPYGTAGEGGTDRIHFLCYQYNAFEFLDLVYYWQLSGDASLCPLLKNLAGYLAGGLTTEGAARYDCHHITPTVTYYAAAIACALRVASRHQLGSYWAISERGYRWLLKRQQPDGNFASYSTKNYRFLSDRRSYPRYLGMILHHLLVAEEIGRDAGSGKIFFHADTGKR